MFKQELAHAVATAITLKPGGNRSPIGFKRFTGRVRSENWAFCFLLLSVLFCSV